MGVRSARERGGPARRPGDPHERGGEAIIAVAAGLTEGARRFAVAHELGHLYVPRKRRVQPGSVGYRAHVSRACPEAAEVVPAHAWFPGAKPGVKLVEHAMQVPGAILSLLWAR